jgi:hypothetical protein
MVFSKIALIVPLQASNNQGLKNRSNLPKFTGLVVNDFSKIGTVHTKIRTVLTKIGTIHLKFGENNQNRPGPIFFNPLNF